MNFSESLKASTTAERDLQIEEQIHDNCADISDRLDGDQLHYGGFPDDVTIDRVTIYDDGSDTIVVTIDVDFYESVASCCKDFNLNHPGTAVFRLEIDKTTGDGEFYDPTVEIRWAYDHDDDEMEVHEDDYK